MAQDDLPKHIACALCYSVFALTGLLFLTMTPYSRNREIRVHALQSIFLTTVFLLFWFGLSIVSFAVPAFLNVLVGMVMVLFWLAFLGCWGASMVKAFNRGRLALPLISELAQKFA